MACGVGERCGESLMGTGRGDTGRNVHSSESESGVPGVEGVRRSLVHMRLDSGESASSQRRLPPTRLGRLTGLKDDARMAIGDRLRRVVYLRVGDGDTTGENLRDTMIRCNTSTIRLNIHFRILLVLIRHQSIYNTVK